MAGAEWKVQNTGRYQIFQEVAESSFMRKPIYEYSPCCGAAQGYKKFITEYTGKAR